MITTLRSLVGPGRAQTETVYECRHCGTTVDPDAAQCPSCGRTQFAEFSIR
ncbi:MAG: zinc-ribbon domain-containing protein [Halobacteriaceae archaeon]